MNGIQLLVAHIEGLPAGHQALLAKKVRQAIRRTVQSCRAVEFLFGGNGRSPELEQIIFAESLIFERPDTLDEPLLATATAPPTSRL